MTSKEKKPFIRIGNAGGYWGDDPTALERQVRGGNLDYITMDFLAEVTMSIMQKQKARDPQLGYARDFIHMLKPILGDLLKQGTKIITNAGGVNPVQCAKEIYKLAEELNLPLKIAIVHGDDIMNDIDALREKGASFQNMEDGRAFDTVRDRIESANIYFGATAVVEALKQDPDMIITGRVTDTGITVAAMMHEFDWDPEDMDKIAAGTVAGHLLECGCQATGGNFTDWEKVPSFTDIGYPIAEVYPDGQFVLTKHEGTGGLVSVDTAREQIFYEMGNPRAYITPDVVVDFSTIELEAEGPNRVRVKSVKGLSPTPLYKISMAYRDGYKAAGSIMISGPNARRKAEKFASIFWEKIGSDFTETGTEYIGHDACHRSLGGASDGEEVLLRLGARSPNKDALRAFGKLIPSLILSGPPGVAVIGGVPKVTDVVSYWPALMDKSLVEPKIAVYNGSELTEVSLGTSVPTGEFDPSKASGEGVKGVAVAEKPSASIDEVFSTVPTATETLPISTIALARSGDKGDMANVGVLARSPKAYTFLKEFLTPQRVKNWFQELCYGPVTRYELDKLRGLNFLLDASLGGGGTQTLRTDAQGKTFSQALIRQKITIPSDVLEDVKKHENIWS